MSPRKDDPYYVAVYKTNEKLTRGQFVLELLNNWQDALDTAQSWRVPAAVRKELEISINTLKSTYSTYELMDLSGYEEQLKDAGIRPKQHNPNRQGNPKAKPKKRP